MSRIAVTLTTINTPALLEDFLALMERYGIIKAHVSQEAEISSTPDPTPVPVGQRFPLAARALPRLAGAARARRLFR